MSDNLDAKVSTRMTQASYVIPPDANTVAIATRDINNQTPAANSLGAAVNSAASAGDPWSTVLPGAYAANTAGKIIGTQLDVATSSRLAAANYVVPPTIQTIAVAVRDVDNTTPATNSLGAAVNRAASAGDPWGAQLPGGYGVGTAGKLMSDNLDAKVSTRLATTAYVVPPNVNQIAAANRDVDNSSPAVGSLGEAVNSAASAGDPWGTPLPGTYAAGTAGDLIGNNIDAKISTRLPASSYVRLRAPRLWPRVVRDIDNTTRTNSLERMSCVRGGGDP
jgi:hypothetical protein